MSQKLGSQSAVRQYKRLLAEPCKLESTGDNDGDNIIHGLECLKEIANNDCSADALLQIISKLRIADNTTLSAEDMSDWLQSDSSQGTCLPLSDEIILDDVSNRVTNCSASSDSTALTLILNLMIHLMTKM